MHLQQLWEHDVGLHELDVFRYISWMLKKIFIVRAKMKIKVETAADRKVYLKSLDIAMNVLGCCVHSLSAAELMMSYAVLAGNPGKHFW